MDGMIQELRIRAFNEIKRDAILQNTTQNHSDKNNGPVLPTNDGEAMTEQQLYCTNEVSMYTHDEHKRI